MMAGTGTPPRCTSPSKRGWKPGVMRSQACQAPRCRKSCTPTSGCWSASPISIVSVRHMAWKGNPHGWEKNHGPSSAPEQSWQDGAGGLLLVAAAHETGLLAQLETAIAPCLTQTAHPRLSPSCRSQRSLLLMLLFLNAVGLRRTRDLRGYTGEALALLTGRRRAYSYWHTERFLTLLATGGGAEVLTNALGKWSERYGSREESRKWLAVSTSMGIASPSMQTS